MLLVLRSAGPAGWNVIGECYMHGFMDGEGLLGPLPKEIEVRCERGQTGHHQVDFSYFNSNTSKTVPDDPRINSLPPNLVLADGVICPNPSSSPAVTAACCPKIKEFALV